MNCKSCQRELMSDSFFCTWCSRFVTNPSQGVRAGVFARFGVSLLDGLMFWVLWFLGTMIVPAMAIIVPVAYFIFYLIMLAKGTTPAKKMFGMSVSHTQSGQPAGFGRMLLREFIGKFVSGLVFSVGYLWAIWDRNSQGWHDKIANTVVIKQKPMTATHSTRPEPVLTR